MALRHVHPTAIGSGSGGHVPTRNPDGGGVREEAGEALRELREEAAWSAWVEEGGSGGDRPSSPFPFLLPQFAT